MIVRLTFDKLYQYDLEDIATFLKDLVFLHGRIAILAPYNLNNIKTFKYIYKSKYFYRRFSHPLPETDKLKVSHIHLSSPLSIELILGIAIGFPAAAKAFIEFIKLIRDWELDRERKQLQNIELRLKIKKIIKEFNIIDINKMNANLNIEELSVLIEKDVIRLSRHEVKIKEVELKDKNGNK